MSKQLKSYLSADFNGQVKPLLFKTLKPIESCPAQALFEDLSKQHNAILQAQPANTITAQNKSIAILFSGGPAPGGHNVICAVAKLCELTNSTLYGVENGPGGLIKGDLRILSSKECDAYFDAGGFHLLGTDRTKIKTEQQYKAIEAVVKRYSLDGIIIIGGDDSNTNAVFLAQRLLPLNCAVVGVPKTIDGDLKAPPYLPISFGFHTAVNCYATLVETLVRDTKSVKKYWHIVKLMGRHRGYVADAVAKQAKPDLCITGEFVKQQNMNFSELIDYIEQFIVSSIQDKNKNYGVICLAEGLLEWLDTDDLSTIISGDISYDSHGNVELSLIQLELVIMEALSERLTARLGPDVFKALPHFYGYEGRCVKPNAFDASYTTRLGLVAVSLVFEGITGYLAACDGAGEHAKYYALPIWMLLHEEERQGAMHWVIKK